MHKTLINVICAFVPKRKCRHRLRNKLLHKVKSTPVKESPKPIPSPVAQTNPANPNFIVKGQNNKLVLIDEQGNEKPMTTNIPGMKINVYGDNNTIKIHLPLKSKNASIDIGNDNAYIELGPSFRNFTITIAAKAGDSQRCIIGKDTSIVNASITLNEKSACFIGEDCMLSGMIKIWPTDGHSILDAETGEVLNRADTPLIIGNHVWIGEGARITKKAHIYDNSVVAGGAVACKDYKESGVVIAGNPGKIVKRGITWSRMNPWGFEQKEIKENKK